MQVQSSTRLPNVALPACANAASGQASGTPSHAFAEMLAAHQPPAQAQRESPRDTPDARRHAAPDASHETRPADESRPSADAASTDAANSRDDDDKQDDDAGAATAVPGHGMPTQAMPAARPASMKSGEAGETDALAPALDASASGTRTARGAARAAMPGGAAAKAQTPGQAGEHVAAGAARADSPAEKTADALLGAALPLAVPTHEAPAAMSQLPDTSTLAAAAGLQAAPRADAQAASLTTAAAVHIATPATSPEFREALGVQVSVLAREGIQQAELHLHPADMGPISVLIALDGSNARVDFGADSPATRSLLESGLPELAAALRDAGFTLSGGGVSQHARQQPNQEAQQAQSAGTRTTPAALGEAGPVRMTARMGQGAVDLYA
jgi:flagellar hook-length control protein FliK